MTDYTPVVWNNGDDFQAAQATAMSAKVDELESMLGNVKNYGATGNGSTDDTTAINNALAAGGITFFPAGTYIHTGLTLPGGARLKGVGTGHYGTAAPTSQRSILKMKNATNATSITVPEFNSYGVIEDLEIDGNKVNQTTAGVGISFSDGGSSQECGWELHRIEVYNTYGIGLYVGNFRQALYAEHVLVINTGQHGVQVVGTDATFIKLMIGACGSGWKGLVASGEMTRFIGGEVWSQPGGAGAVVVGPLISIIGMGFDRNDQEGIILDTGAETTIISGCSFHSNSQSADNTYSDIKVNVSGNFTIVGNAFSSLDGGITNKRKYAIEVGANRVIASGNSHVSAATGTAFSDKPGQLIDTMSSNAPRVGTVASSATPTINCDLYDQYNITALAAAITVINVTGTPADGQPLWIRFKDNGTLRAIAHGSSFVAGPAALLTTTAANKVHLSQYKYDSVAAKWACTMVHTAGY